MTWRVARSTRPPSSAPSYADVRVVRRQEQSASVKGGQVDGLSLGETEGFGVRVLVDGAWGFASSGRMDGRDGGRCRRPGGAHRPRLRPSCARTRSSWPIARRRWGATRRPWPRIPSRCPSTSTVGMLLEAERAMAAVPGITISQGRLPRLPGVEELPGHGWLGDRAGHHARRCRAGGAGRRRRRPAAAQLPESGGYRAAGYEHIRSPRPRGAGAGPGRGGRGAALRARAAAGPPHDRPAPLAAVPPDPRVLRPPHRARPRLRHGGRLRRHQLPDHGQARVGLPLRLRPGDHRRRRHHAGRPGHLRLGRRGRRRAARAARAARASSAAT